MKLTELKLRNIRYADKIKLYADGNGLFLCVSKTKKKWQLSIRKGTKVVHFYGDEYPTMSLKAAREWAEETRELALGSDIQGKSQLSFTHYAELYRNR
ncbi:hypothetical protein BDW_08420 [Bdellovibrio bacteriovorus W]|nr:hypothetical protein BDW_08420 [Bdellovibrio bacteriovorus W]